MAAELPIILVILELDTYVDSQVGRYSSFPKFLAMYVQVTYKSTSGTKTHLFLLKPMASLETSRVITDCICICMLKEKGEKKEMKRKE